MSKVTTSMTATLLATTALSCAVVPSQDELVLSNATRYAQRIEFAHGASDWRAQKAVQADVTVEFGDQTYLKGTMLFDTPVGRVRMELSDGSVLVFDGKKAWTSPADAKHQSARFDLLTWPYFVAAPMKMRDPGTVLTVQHAMPLHGTPMTTAKLTFDSGVGDSPNDWYLLYADEMNHRLVAMAYIVTFGKKDIQEAQKEPHAITYEDFETIDGVVISTRWRFWHWDATQGVHGEPIGRASLDNIRFVNPAPDAFVRPPDSRLSPGPGA